MPGQLELCTQCKGMIAKKSWRYCPYCGIKLDSELIPAGIVWNVVVPATALTNNWQHRPNTTYRLLFPIGFDSFKAVSAAALSPELPENTWVVGYYEDEKQVAGIMAIMLFEVIGDPLRLSSTNIGPCFIFLSY